MRVVLDTNIIVSALIATAGKPASIIDAWLEGRFTLLTCTAHVDELRATLQKPRVAELVKPHKAGRLVNQVKKHAEDIDPLPRVARSPDPTDDFLLALCEAGKADYLVTGDKSGLLALGRHKGTQIVSARDFATLLATAASGSALIEQESVAPLAPPDLPDHAITRVVLVVPMPATPVKMPI